MSIRRKPALKRYIDIPERMPCFFFTLLIYISGILACRGVFWGFTLNKYTVKYILIECTDLAHMRKTFYSANNMKELSQNTEINNVI